MLEERVREEKNEMKSDRESRSMISKGERAS